MKIQIDGAYSDGHEYLRVEEIPEYTGDDFDNETDDTLSNHLFEFTGDGHGTDNDLGHYCEVTIIEAANPALVGKVEEFG